MGRTISPLTPDEIRRSFQLFFGNDAQILDELTEAANLKSFKTGQMVVSQEDDTDDIYYIMQGVARASLVTETGSETWLDTFHPGSLIGEMAALLNKERSATIHAIKPLQVAIFSKGDFFSIARKHGDIGLRIARMIAERVEHTSRRMNELYTLSSENRVYAELLRMAEQDPESGLYIIPNLPTKTRIAEKVNTARETVSRAISKFEDMGLVKQDEGGRIIITGQTFPQL
jgi:CRP-like cAMP-binding protein